MSNDTVILFNGIGGDDEPALWVTSGTLGTTSEVEADLDPKSITNFNGEALFEGTDGSSEFGLFVTNGTAGGTLEIGGSGSTDITDAYSGGLGLQPGYFLVYKGEALFQGAAGNGASGPIFGLWETNGTTSGTVEIGGNKNVGIKNADPVACS